MKKFHVSFSPPSKKHAVIRWSIALAAAALSAAVVLVSRQSTAFADWFCSYIYPVFSGIGSRLWGIFPFSVGELIVIAAVPAVIAGAIFLAVYVKHRRGRRVAAFFSGFSWFGCIAALLFVTVAFNCLVCYGRTPFSSYSGLTLREYTVEELTEFTEYLIEKANESAAEAVLDSEGRPVRPDNFEEAAVNAMENLSRQYPLLQTYYPQPKAVMISEVMSRFNLAGMYFPVTVEANYNNAMPVSSQGFTVCHELSHLSGFLREDEANFIAFLACRESGDAYFCYSGYIGALTYTLNAVYSAVTSEEYSRLYSMLSPVIIAELSYRNQYWEPYRDKVTYQASTAINDAYLKANNQTDGAKSYGRMVDLMLAEWSLGG